MYQFHEISVHVTCGCGLVLLCRQHSTLCTSGFVIDVMFSHDGAHAVVRQQWSSTSDPSPLSERYRVAHSGQQMI